MGLIFAEDLVAWQRWQRSRHVLRRARDVVRRPDAVVPVLHTRGAEPAVLFALDATTPTALASVLEPLTHLGDVPVAVVAPADVSATLPGEWQVRSVSGLDADLRGVRAVVSAGHFLPIGAVGLTWAQQLRARYVVVQHGLITPFMPPLPPDAHLLAFSEADADFWRSGRTDITSDVVGSQLLWHAGRPLDSDAAEPHHGDLTFLGQLHGAELARRTSAITATRFCLENDALYRPHPAEVDRVSRWQHKRWRSRGIRFAPEGPLREMTGPVVSIFSTGVLEAVASGRDAWVTCVNPPDWVREFWQRYRLSPWGEAPTEPPVRPAIEPAQRIAEAVRDVTAIG